MAINDRQDPEQKSREDKDRKLVDSLMRFKKGQAFEVWKVFEERANKLGDRLWSTGTWLMSLIGATLGLPFVSKFIVYSDATHKMEIKQNLPVQLVSVFGVGLCLYAYYALRDIRFHVARNWTRANYARTDEWKEVTMQHDKKFGWNVLMVIGSFAFLAFVSLFLITFPAVRPTFAWCCNL